MTLAKLRSLHPCPPSSACWASRAASAAFVCHVLLLIHAFKKSTTEGLLTLCVPCYGIYYAFTKFEHENKNLIIALYLGGGFASGVFRGLAQAMQ